jgi:hypothetical protein
MMKLKVYPALIACSLMLAASGNREKIITVKPAEYVNALRNPLERIHYPGN